MGEIEAKGGKRGGGERKKERGVGGGGGKDGIAPVVLKTDLHGKGCAGKAEKILKGIAGVEKVRLSMNNEVTIWGNADPRKIMEKIKKETRNDVEIVSPVARPEKRKGNEAQERKGGERERKKERGGGGKDAKKSKENGAKGGEGEKKEGRGGGKDGNAHVVKRPIKRSPVGIENADLREIKKWIEAKTGKKVDLVYRANHPKNTKDNNNGIININYNGNVIIININNNEEDGGARNETAKTLAAAAKATVAAIAAVATGAPVTPVALAFVTAVLGAITN